METKPGQRSSITRISRFSMETLCDEKLWFSILFLRCAKRVVIDACFFARFPNEFQVKLQKQKFVLIKNLTSSGVVVHHHATGSNRRTMTRSNRK